MKTLIKRISQEYTTLKRQIACLKGRSADFPDGRIHVSYKNGCPQYYRVEGKQSDHNRRRKYIRAKERNLAEQISQRDYERKLLKDLEMREKTLAEVIRAYEKTSPENILLDFSKGKRDLIKPLFLPDELYIEEWRSEEYSGRPFEKDAPEILTARGERVRSKSEKIIADTLERYNIPYKYECPLTLPSGITIYPDFRVLNVQDRKEVIWEHFGMMNNEKYASNAVLKINSYMNNGYYLGDQLIISMESTQTSLSTKLIEEIIKRYLVSES